MDVKDKIITVVGLGKSGYAAAAFLKRRGAEVRITEAGVRDDVIAHFPDMNETDYDIQWGGHTKDFIAGSELLVISPGVRADSDCVLWAKEMGIKVISEIELVALFCKSPIIAVTGTNGKSTVTSLIGEVVKLKGLKPFVCGNIGLPFSDIVDSVDDDSVVVLELSSFQLEFIDTFRPYIAVFLNITDDHYDHHKDLSEYLNAKLRIFENQRESDWAVLNSQYEQLTSYADSINAGIKLFGEEEGYNENECAVLEVADILDVDRGKVSDMFKEYRRLPYRMEDIGNLRGIPFINDSKSTNPGSTLWALKNINTGVVLIMCGRDKNNDFTVLRPYMSGKVRHLILFGEAADKIHASLEGYVDISEADTLQESIMLASEAAQEGDTVLFSPGCASFDMFKNYVDRGRQFTETFKQLKAKIYA